MLLKAIKKGCRFREVSISTVRREHGKAKLSSYSDGIGILRKILSIRFLG